MNEINKLQATAFGSASTGKATNSEKTQKDDSIFNNGVARKQASLGTEDTGSALGQLQDLLDEAKYPTGNLPEIEGSETVMPEPPADNNDQGPFTRLSERQQENIAEQREIENSILEKSREKNDQGPFTRLSERKQKIDAERREIENSALELSRENREAMRAAMWNMIKNEDE